MILKALSRRGKDGHRTVLKYVLRYVYRDTAVSKRRSRKTYIPVAEKDNLEDRIPYLYALRSANVRFYRRDIDHLIQEKVDAELLRDFMRTTHGRQHSEYLRKYMAQEKEFGEKDQFILTHNIRPYNSIDDIIRQFEDNDRNRINRRKDTPVLQHVVLSFGKSDSSKVTDEILRDIIQKYISLNGENLIYTAAKHSNTEAIHAHVVVSTSSIEGKNARISKEKFASIKDKLQEYQKQKYPFLENSLPEHGRKTKEKIKSSIQKKSDERESVKSKLMEAITTLRPKSTKHLLEELSAQGFVSYNRADQLTGIRHTESNLKFRFKTIGVDLEELKQLDELHKKEEEMLADISRLRNSGQKRLLEIDEAERGETNVAVKDIDDLKDIEGLRESRLSEQELDEPEREFESDDDDVPDAEVDEYGGTDDDFDEVEREPNEEYDEDEAEENENSYE